MNVEFKCWLCICKHEYHKLINVTLFDKLIEHNLIKTHNFYVVWN